MFLGLIEFWNKSIFLWREDECVDEFEIFLLEVVLYIVNGNIVIKLLVLKECNKDLRFFGFLGEDFINVYIDMKCIKF